jgi:hypothetical protein
MVEEFGELMLSVVGKFETTRRVAMAATPWHDNIQACSATRFTTEHAYKWTSGRN